MLNVIINPGSGPVSGASLANAEANILQFIKDCGFPDIQHRRCEALDERGRFGFILSRPGTEVEHEVEMPGLPIEQVRWMKEPGQSILAFPRLYVGGSSWIWQFALLGEARDWTTEED